MATAEVKETVKEKLKALQLTIDKIEKAYGKGTIMKMGDEAVEQVESIGQAACRPQDQVPDRRRRPHAGVSEGHPARYAGKRPQNA